MFNNYEDIRSKIQEEPTWYDEHGVPRFCEPNPEHAPNIYANEVVFYVISCQNCGREFVVEESEADADRMVQAIMAERELVPTLRERAANRALHYGDPPNHGCIGDTMNCEDIRVVSFWERRFKQGEKIDFDWHRVPELDGAPLADEAATTA